MVCRRSVHRLFAAAFALTVLGSLPQGGAARQAREARAAADTVHKVTLVDGSTVIGRIVEADSTKVVVLTSTGARFEIERSNIASLRPVAGRIVNGEIWPEDANGTRLFFGPTGRALGHGRGYVGLYELFFSFAAVGIGDRVTMAAGTPILPGLMGEVFYLAPKVTVVNAPRLQVAAGALAFFATREIDEGSVGIAYGVASFGDADAALTFGAGWGFALVGDDSEIADEPVFMLGLERRVSRAMKLMSENYFANDNALISLGVRAMGERFSGDAGAGAVVSGGDSSCCIPILSFTWRF
jgi:hypothetical protein